MPVEGTRDLKQLIRNIRLAQSYIQSMEGEEVQSGENREVLLYGPVLWQDSETGSAEDKALFEHDNQELVDRMRIAKQTIHRILKGK